MKETLLPTGVAQVDLDRLDAKRAQPFDPGHDVRDLEGEVVRALAAVLEEAEQEIVLGIGDRLPRLKPDPAGGRRLGTPPALLGEAGHLPSAGATGGTRKRFIGAVHTDREVVEQGPVSHSAKTQTDCQRGL